MEKSNFCPDKLINDAEPEEVIDDEDTEEEE